ncbi:MAG: class I SAM-dependent rRNA methyltransferase [Oscillospiraceae bacterium]|nr:class I SAM-dependent rRNA methyltransferase [Oscillospiraceae bacterium]
MSAERPYPSVTVTEKGERALRDGHPWVYGDEVTAVRGKPEDGGIADVFSKKGAWLGAGFYNAASRIRVRVLSRNANDRFDAAFFRRRAAYAVDYRLQVMGPDFGCCRLVFGEADGLPGLTVDRFGDVLVMQTACLGLEQRKGLVASELMAVLRGRGQEIRAVYERNDLPVREKEGLAQGKGFLWGAGDGTVRIRENGLLYDVDYINGQKTGFFLDQKYNRAAAAKLARGRRVLDCFTHTGAFALNAAAGGAERVTAVDVSDEALDRARANAALNGLAVDFQKADVFELLTGLDEARRREFDYIILDPPAFTKSSSTVAAAAAGYREINRRAMRLLPRGGYLATCSCSHFMTEPLFRRTLRAAAEDAGVTLRQIEARRQSPDHPILWGVPETDYLKFYLFQVV